MAGRESPRGPLIDPASNPGPKCPDATAARPALLRTPAGPIPEDKLSHVAPAKRVRRTPQGDYVIEDSDAADGRGAPSQAENEDG